MTQLICMNLGAQIELRRLRVLEHDIHNIGSLDCKQSKAYQFVSFATVLRRA